MCEEFSSDVSDSAEYSDFDSSEFSDSFDDISDVEFDDADIDFSEDSFEMEDVSDDIETDFADDMSDVGFDDIDISDESFEIEDVSNDIETDFTDDMGDVDFDDSDIDVSDDSFEMEDISDDVGTDFSDDIDEVDFDDSDMDFSEDSFEMEDVSDDIETDFADDMSDVGFDDIDVSDDSFEMEDISDDIETDFTDDMGEVEFDDADADISGDSQDSEIVVDTEDDESAYITEVDDLGDMDEVYGISDDIDNEDTGGEEIDADVPNESELVSLEGDEFVDTEEVSMSDTDEIIEQQNDIIWDNMLSDGDRDYINDVLNNETYTQEQKDYLISDHLREVYERETAEPEYGARVKGLTYDGRDIITRPPESFGEPVADGDLVNEAINNENLSTENLRNLRNYIDSISNDESLSNDEKEYLINEALYAASAMDSEMVPEIETESELFEETTESVAEGIVNEYNEPFSGELSEQDYEDIYEGLEEYDFNGIDCLEDVERLDSSLESFSAENWEQLSVEEQKEKMEDLASYIIDVTDLKNPPQIVFYNNEEIGDYGGFNRSTNTLSINEYMLYQNDEAADTVAHELWHAYQYQRARNPQTKLDYMYAENFNDYITPEDFDGYQSQLIESEARAFAQQIKDRLKSF